MQIINLCLSDIPKDKITESKTNGKKYISLAVDDRKEPDKFGNDVTVYVNQSKEEREAKKDKIYVGNGKTYSFDKPKETAKTNASQDDDELPF